MNSRFFHRSLVACMMFVGLLAAVTPAHSAEKKDKSAKRIALMMQKMQQEKAEMQAQFDQEKAGLEEKVKKKEQESAEIKAAAARKSRMLSAELEAMRQEKVELEAKQQKTDAILLQTQSALENAGKKLAAISQQQQAAQREIKDGDSQRKELLGNLSKKGQQLIACTEKNAKLHDFGQELIKFYEKPSLVGSEPFTQIKRVELENILQDYRDKLDEQRIGLANR